MPRIKECPKCETDISDTYENAEPDVGIFGSGWFCENCNLFVEANDQDDYDDRRKDD